MSKKNSSKENDNDDGNKNHDDDANDGNETYVAQNVVDLLKPTNPPSTNRWIDSLFFDSLIYQIEPPSSP